LAGNAGFASPEIHEFLEAKRAGYTIRQGLAGQSWSPWRGQNNQFDPGEALRTDDFAAKAGTCGRISLHRHLGGRTITLNGSGIRECRFK
jgi:hypothetical protein